MRAPPSACSASSIAIVIGPDAAGHRRDRPRRLARGVEVDVARPGPRRCGSCRRRSPSRPASPSRRVISRGAADGRDEHVGAPADLGEVARARVADRHGGVLARAAAMRAACRRGRCGRRRPPRRPRARRPARAQQLHHARRGVAGHERPRPCASRPALVGVRPSTSLSGSIARDHVGRVDLRRAAEAGPGCLNLGVAFSSSTRSSSSSCGRVARQLVADRADADLLAWPGACRPRRCGRPRRRRRAPSQGRAPSPTASRCRSTSAFTSARTRAAIALPSMISAAMRGSVGVALNLGATSAAAARSRPSAGARSRRRRSGRPPRRPADAGHDALAEGGVDDVVADVEGQRRARVGAGARVRHDVVCGRPPRRRSAPAGSSSRKREGMLYERAPYSERVRANVM